jgi:hypothetical protein
MAVSGGEYNVTSAEAPISPMEELAQLRRRHEMLMKQHAHLRDEVVERLREDCARTESECAEMSALVNFLKDRQPRATNYPQGEPADPLAAQMRHMQRMELDRMKHEAEPQAARAYR